MGLCNRFPQLLQAGYCRFLRDRRKTLGVRYRLTSLSPHASPGFDPGSTEVGDPNDDRYVSLTPPLLILCMRLRLVAACEQA